MVGNPVVATPIKSGMGFFGTFRLIMLIFVFGTILINFIIIAFAQKDLAGGLSYLGDNFLSTTQKLQDESLKLIERGTTIPEDTTKLQNMLSFTKNIWDLISALFIIYVWLWILASIFLWFPLGDTSKKFAAWCIAIIVFLLLQMVITKSFSIPLKAFEDFGKAMVSLFKPATDAANNSLKELKNLSSAINATI